jgi:23S rRNA (cytidine1920-2'-O)/16S rRNA (cytidine1409-2'-O)-methyltransferase
VDRLVVERGLVSSREKARRLILAGEVLVNDSRVDKPGTLVSDTASIRLRTAPKPYVGRGGEKLEGALDAVGLDVTGMRAIDIGSSTGGFTDCLLQRGAAHVTAVDVGRGQLDWKLASDPRVLVMDGVNARYLKPSDFAEPFEPFDIATVDVSFISLTKILPAVAGLLRRESYLFALVKPQFELEPRDIEKGGLVTSPERRFAAVQRVLRAALACGLAPSDVIASPIAGASGNQEFFVVAQAVLLDATADRDRERDRDRETWDWSELDERAKRECGVASE